MNKQPLTVTFKHELILRQSHEALLPDCVIWGTACVLITDLLVIVWSLCDRAELYETRFFFLVILFCFCAVWWKLNMTGFIFLQCPPPPSDIMTFALTVKSQKSSVWWWRRHLRHLQALILHFPSCSLTASSSDCVSWLKFVVNSAINSVTSTSAEARKTNPGDDVRAADSSHSRSRDTVRSGSLFYFIFILFFGCVLY